MRPVSILTRKMLRDLWQIRWRALAVVLTVGSGVGIYAGSGMAIGTGFHTRDVLLERMHFADLEVLFLPEDVENLPDLKRIPGVRAVERRLVLPGTVFLADNNRISGLLVFLEAAAPTLDSLELIQGGPVRPQDFESAVIERSLALFHGFKVGDRIRVQVGEKVYESRIDGVAVSPEYLVTTANPEYLVPEKGSLGVVFTGLPRVSDSLGFTMVNDLLFRFEPGADPHTVQEAVVARLGRLNLERVIPSKEHFMWRFVQVEMEAFQVYAPCIVLTFAILSFILTLITMNRLVLDQRREIGALLALGYRRGQVLRAYLKAGVLLGATGGIVGMVFTFVFRNLFAEPYAHALGMPDVIMALEPPLLVIGFCAAVIETTAATAWPVWRMLRLTPQAIIRERVGEGGGFGRWVRVAFAAMMVLPLPVRFGVRNMIRRPGRSLSTILAIGFSLGVPIAFTVSLTSALQTPEIVFGREGWDLAVDFLYPVLPQDLAPIRSLAGTAKVEPYFRRFAELGANGHYESATILGLQTDSTMKRTSLAEGRALSGDPNEVIVSHDLARRMKLHLGDPVTIRIRSGQEFPRRVVGISGEMIPGQIIMPFRQAQIITDFEDAATGVYIATPAPDSRLTAALSGVEYVSKVTTKTGVVDAFRTLVSGMMKMIYVDLGVSVFVAMLFIFMSVNLVISERQTEYATFKCLGYGRGRLRAMVLAQAFSEGGLAALVSIPVGILLAVYLNARVSQAWHRVFNIFRWEDFILVLVIAMALIPFSAYPGLRILDRLNIVDALGTRKIE